MKAEFHTVTATVGCLACISFSTTVTTDCIKLEAVVPADHYRCWDKLSHFVEDDIQVHRWQYHNAHIVGSPCLRIIQIVAGLSHGAVWRLSVQCCEELLRDYHEVCLRHTLLHQHVNEPRKAVAPSVFAAVDSYPPMHGLQAAVSERCPPKSAHLALTSMTITYHFYIWMARRPCG